MSGERVKVAIVGCGQWGLNHVRTATKVFAEDFVALCEPSAERLEKARAIAPNVEVLTFEALLERKEISAVIVATPAATHYAIAKQLLLAGKDVLVEKPLTLFPQEAEELIALAKRQQRLLMVGHVLLFHPAIRAIKELITQGRLGRLQYISSNRLNLGSIRREENILWSFAPHDISVLQYLIGSEPIEVDAKGGVFATQRIS